MMRRILMSNIVVSMLRPFAKMFVRLLRRTYIKKCQEYMNAQSNINIRYLELLQFMLYFMKSQFQAWGYFHQDCTWTEADEKEFRKLFPTKTHQEPDLIISRNPEAFTFYHNLIFHYEEAMKLTPTNYPREIRDQLKAWNNWN